LHNSTVDFIYRFYIVTIYLLDIWTSLKLSEMLWSETIYREKNEINWNVIL